MDKQVEGSMKEWMDEWGKEKFELKCPSIFSFQNIFVT